MYCLSSFTFCHLYRFRFLHNTDSAEYRYFDNKVREMEAKLGKSAGALGAASCQPSGLRAWCRQAHAHSIETSRG